MKHAAPSDPDQSQPDQQPPPPQRHDSAHSPIRAQYLGVKRQYPDAIVLFRLGDFYELFDEDAELAARELELTLTKRDWGRGEKSPMAGFPHHAADGYIARLIARGYRVAVCEQMTDPALARGLVEREVVRVVTPGTVVDPAMLAAKRNNYLAAAVLGRDAVGVAYVDVTTGEFATTQWHAPDPETALLQELARVQPAEVLVDLTPSPSPTRRGETAPRPLADTAAGESSAPSPPSLVGTPPPPSLVGTPPPPSLVGTPPPPSLVGKGAGGLGLPDDEESDVAGGLAARLRELDARLSTVVTPWPARHFRDESARACLLDHFGVTSLEGFGCQHLPLAVRAAGAVVAYLRETQKGALAQLNALETYSTTGFMALDTYTRRNLELFESGRGGGVKGSLLWVLDHTRTPMGGRLLRRWLGEPLLDLGALRRRQDAVAAALADVLLRARLVPVLGHVGDLERLTNRVLQRIATPRDLVALAAGLRAADEALTLAAPLLPAPPTHTATPAATPAPLAAHDSAAEAATTPAAYPPAHSSAATSADNGDHAAASLSAGTSTGTGDDSASPFPGRSWGREEGSLAAIATLIERAIVDAPPLTLTDGGVIRASYSAELDGIATAARDARQWVANLERGERERTGIPNLKVGFNKVFGYYLEVTNSHASKVPADYIRKQTVTTGERFITPDLKEYEALILNAQEKSVKLEQELFAQLRAEIATQHAERVKRVAHTLAELDVVLSLAEVAERQGYCRPELDDGDTLHVVAARHPVVEMSQGDTPFVPNDIELATHDAQILLLTGPNMAGKSTYLRQVALIVLLAQIGSFVPAEAARIGLVDRIFTRIGAQDDLATGQSTFMVEMVETANILHHATPRSLVVLDEIGRGTSTYDGLAIARAIVEYLHNNRRCGAKTLFATHYHELVELARTLPRVRAYNVAVSEDEGRVIFLRKIVPGGADKSYGIHVAQLAGIPRQVVRRAEEVLEKLEHTGDTRTRRRSMRHIPDMVMPQALQLTLFTGEPDPLVEELKALAVDELTPLEALTRLYELQRKAREQH